MKLINLLAILLGIVAFVFLYCLGIYIVHVGDKPVEDYKLEVYTAEDILFINIDSSHVTSESGNIDTIFNDKKQLIEFIATTTARQTDACLMFKQEYGPLFEDLK